MSAGGGAGVDGLARRMEEALTGQARFFVELVALAEDGRYRDVLRAWGLVRQRCALERDEEGRYRIAGSAAGKGGR